MPVPPEGDRLKRLYEHLRLRLLDLSKRNQLLNYRLSTRSKRFLRIVDGPLEDAHQRLVREEAPLRIAPLPEPDDIPSEERTDEFRLELDRARATDVEYLTAVEAIEATGRDDDAAMEKLERQLRDRLREDLGLPPRPSRRELNRGDHARTLGIDPSLDLDPARDNGDGRVLQTLKFPDELEATMEKISGAARLAEQEMGLSTLFLAFGFLEWYDSDTSDKKACAPLLLLPVQIDKQQVRGKPVYSLSVREGGAETNLSLQKNLEQNFSRKLPDFEADGEDGLGSIEAYVSSVKTAIEGLKRWQVRRWLVLGHFSFGRFAMYSDLEPEKWGEPAAHALVGSLLRGSEHRDGEGLLPGVPDDYPIDDPEIEAIAPFLIQDADASQHSAIIDVMKGSNLVIQGPPGTGKSQTITNVIANALAAGKRVLFLAEKQAALEVVKRRLDRSGLGDFCLELHSSKASPKTVVANLATRYDLGIGLDLPVTQRIDPTWRQSREEITSYVRALHASASDGATAFDLIWRSLRGRTTHVDLADAFKDVNIPTDLLQDPGRLSEIDGDVKILAGMAQTFAGSFGHPGRSPWSQVIFADFPTYDAPRFLQAISALRRPTLATQEVIAHHAGLGVVAADDLATLTDLECRLGDAPEVGVLVAVVDLDLEDIERALAVRSELLRVEGDLAAMPNLRHEDPARLAIAIAIMHSTLAAELSDQVPASAYRFADGEADLLQKLADTAEAVLPALDLLGLGPAAPAWQLPAAASAIDILGTASERYRRWIVELPHACEGSVADAMGRWRPLVDAEASWIANGYRPEVHPAPADLDAAAATLRKGGIGKAFAVLTGSVRAARELCHRIGIDAFPVKIDALAVHVRAVQAFEDDQDIASLFGPAWRGLNTPAEDVRDGVKLRNFLKKSLLHLPGGDGVVERVMALSVDAIASLAPAGPACKRFLVLAPEAEARLGDTPIDRFVLDARRRIAALREFLSIDPHRLLSDFNAPISQIADAHTLLGRAERVRSTLAGYATAVQASALGSSYDRITATTRAIAWTRSIRASGMKEEAKSLLLSHQAGEVRETIRQAARKWAAIVENHMAALASLADFGAEALAAKPHSDLLPLIDDLSERGPELSEFVALRQRRRRLDAAGLAEFLSACDLHAVEPGRIPGIFAAVVAERRAAMARRVAALSSKNGASLGWRRRAFAERDLAKIKADRVTIRARLLKATPPVGSQYGPRRTWTEMGLLANEFPKVKSFTPVRQLLARAGSAIQALKPCFMMSPLSLAKFVAARGLEFDLLVIDEASQMRPEDALGGMLRAKQIVVVGDPKQLPPTDFFVREESQVKDAGASDVEDDDDIDAESILEACQSTFGERRRLKWHYRSRCESLIAFSNRSFYDNTLITFPTAKLGAFSVNLVRVDGTYRARCNPEEAARVAEEAVAFMRHFADAPEDKLPTLGIVAVNVEQREFIDDELRRRSANDPLIELYHEKSKAKGEPFFVKNLENVQGDERDHIFISMTYGPKHGEPTVAQNFGPINRKQGHRRLNVLFTRARVRIGLFTSFGSVDVRPTNLSSEGVHALKNYLEYAETRGRAIVRGIGGEPDSDFEVEVADRLRMKGYAVDLQVGVSVFKIDLGVRHPDHPERFLAGVECDGAAYHSSKSARDRDRIREETLNSLGWDLVRVWSTDWFDNPSLETEKLVRKLEELRRKPAAPFESYPPLHDAETVSPFDDMQEAEVRSDFVDADHQDDASSQPVREEADPSSGLETNVTTDPVPPPPPPTGSELLTGDGPLTPQEATAALEMFREEKIRLSMPDWDAQRSILRPAMIETFVQRQITDPADWHNRIPQYLRTGTNPVEKKNFLDKICEIVERIGIPAAPRPGGDTPTIGGDLRSTNIHVAPTGPTGYKFSEPTGIGPPDRDRFSDAAYTSILKLMIAHVIDVEGPIFEDVLVDRIARAHGLRRSGSQIRHRLVGLLPAGVSRVAEGDRKVVWPFGKKPGEIHVYRKDTTGRRGHDDVPIEELAAIAAPFVRLRMEDEAVLRKIAEEFELGRLREATRVRFKAALRIARQSVIRS